MIFIIVCISWNNKKCFMHFHIIFKNSIVQGFCWKVYIASKFQDMFCFFIHTSTNSSST